MQTTYDGAHSVIIGGGQTSTYTLLSEAPSDWSYNWNIYYMKDANGKHIKLNSDTAPTFTTNTYYYRTTNYAEGKDLWTEFGLVPASRPFIELPPVKTNSIEIPGADGEIDMTETLLGRPTYGVRSGSLTFNVANDVITDTWDVWLYKLTSFVHGKKRHVMLKDDLSYYYEGRVSINSYSVGNTFSTVEIGYTLDTYKRMRWTTTEDWQWNPFDFIFGTIDRSDFKDLVIQPGVTFAKTWTQNELGAAPVTPTFTVVPNVAGTTMTLNYTNSSDGYGIHTFVLNAGTIYNPQIEFACPAPEDKTDIAIVGNGTISIDFRPGRL